MHHMKDVLRLKCNDEAVILDGQGSEFFCRINQLDKSCILLDIIEKHSFKRESLVPKLTVACAVPKKSKIDFIVEKLTEIGVDKIILLKTERTEISLKDSSKKIEKLKKTAEAALKQSGNLFLPKIEFLSFKDLLELKKKENFDLAIMPNLSAGTKVLREMLEKISSNSIMVAIGPEGDFSETEIKSAKEAGFISVNLGKNILRVDTAAIVVAGFIKLYYNSRK